MKNKLLLLLCLAIVILFMLNVVLILDNRSLKETDRLTYEKISDFDYYYNMFRRWNTATIKNNDTKLSPNLKLENEDGNSIFLSQIAERKTEFPKLIIKNSALACNICLEEELKHINNYISTIGPDNVVVLASGYNRRSLQILKQSAPFDFAIHQIERLGIPFEQEYNNLCVFILDEDLVIKSFFIPEKTLPELSESYYTAICETYFKV